jgi:hypothetical protein
VNYSAIPRYDASHPRWKTDLVNTSLEETEFFVLVGRESTLQYPASVDRDDRQVRIVANASVGLDENFLAVLHDNTDAGMTAIRWQRFTSDMGVTRQVAPLRPRMHASSLAGRRAAPTPTHPDPLRFLSRPKDSGRPCRADCMH